MVDIFDLGEMMYKALRQGGAADVVNGGIYHQGQRPINSSKEDIVINQIALTMDTTPQIATTNVNVFIPDKDMNVGDSVVKMPDTARLKYVSRKMEQILRDTRINGVHIYPSSQLVIPEDSIGQHYVNFRVEWNIQK